MTTVPRVQGVDPFDKPQALRQSFTPALHSATYTRSSSGRDLAANCTLSKAARREIAMRCADPEVATRMEVRMKSILDPTFRYTSSANTDLRKTFARIRRENRRQNPVSTRETAETTPKVTPIFRGQRPAA